MNNESCGPRPRSSRAALWRALTLTILGLALAGPLSAADTAGLPSMVAERSMVIQERSFDGIVEAERRSTVSSQVAARIEEVPFDVDDYVERGDIIVQFRNLPAAADLKQAEAAAQEAQARLEEARANHGRIQQLFRQDRISRADMDRTTADLQSAEARVEAAKGALLAAQERFENTVVRAPFSGIVVQRHVEVGEMATVGMPLMTGLSLEHLRVAVDVPQSDIAALRSDADAWVDLPDGGSLAADAIRIFPYADPSTHTFRVRLGLAEGQHGIYPGMWVKVRFLVGERAALLVPQSAVVQRSELTALYVLAEDGAPRLRQVRLGNTQSDGQVAILAGLDAGETVVTDPEAARLLLAAGPN
ncbi:MAG: efflux RND transporter periplasmic adaptor subunit [Xanthomonadales bacterium]|jgi:RND family efflux transporter MFP subunit|nr:efflux RND transporter periplasmic adaptor subunit [Xanthomonadales bacterium]